MTGIFPPEQWEGAFWFAIALIAGSVAAILSVFKRIGWL